MSLSYDVKWKNDLKMYMNTFKSFIFEGNVNDLQPVEDGDGYDYRPFQEVIAEMFGEDYCVVFYDHTKQSGKPITEDDDEDTGGVGAGSDDSNAARTAAFDDAWFNSFTFYRKTIFSESGERIASPNINLFREYYRQTPYMDRLATMATKDMQGSRTIDIRRIFDAMNEFSENLKRPEYAEAKPFMFVLPGVSRYMTRPGSPDDKENAILMTLFNATQIEDTPCRLLLFVDKANDLPTWFESENNNSAVKKLFVPTPDGKFRETFFDLEMRDVMDPIPDNDLNEKRTKFSSYTENYSLRRLRQLKTFIEVESENQEENAPSLKKIGNIDKTVLRFEMGQSKDPWRDPDLMDRIEKIPEKLEGEIQGQDKAIQDVVEALKAAATGVKSPKKNDRRPRAVFFFAGPTGVGKTELSKQISENIFQKQDCMIRFDMSEFREEHSDARLFGAPPGYVGYEAGGELTKAVKQNPFSVILFDEIEKASPRIWDKFLQILGDGRLTDGKGETVYFTQSLIIFTSNLGIAANPVQSDIAKAEKDKEIVNNYAAIKEKEAEIQREEDGEKKKGLVDELRKLYMEKAELRGLTCSDRNDYLFTKCFKELDASDSDEAFNKFVSGSVTSRINDYFNNIGRKEVLGRIGDDNILVFNFMGPTDAAIIADRRIEKFVKYLKEEHDGKMDLEVTKEAYALIKTKVQKNRVLDLGGRGIVDCVDKMIRYPVMKFLSQPDYYGKTGLSAVLDVSEDGDLMVSER